MRDERVRGDVDGSARSPKPGFRRRALARRAGARVRIKGEAARRAALAGAGTAGMTMENVPPGLAEGGGPARHTPVLLAEVLEHLRPGAGMRVIDGTFGAGGYSRAILEASASVLGIDRDPRALKGGRDLAAAWPGRLSLVEGRFSDLDALAGARGFRPADGVVLDVGVSSMQLDDAERGFSFRNDGPLDMRMGGEGGASAADIVNRAPVEALASVIGGLGEERKAGRIARAIVAARAERPITRTGELAEIVRRVASEPGPQRIHPATRTFQALRIYINRELDELALALGAAESVLKEGGRLVVVTFHSLEDRIVKRFLHERSRQTQSSRHEPLRLGAPPTFVSLTRRPLEPGPAELAANPRARSARLRAASRTAAPARALDLRALGVPSLLNVPGPEAFA